MVNATAKLTTPIGVVKFPQVTRPDAKGKYGIALVLDPKDKVAAKWFKEVLDPAIADSEHPKYMKVYKNDKSKNEAGDLEETGLLIINFISHYPINIFDSKGTALETCDIGWGSRVKVAFTLKSFEADGNRGLTKYIRGIQVIELKGGASAESCGFGEEDGYVSEEQKKKDQPWDE